MKITTSAAEQIRDAAATVRDRKASYELAIEQRDDLIREAIDAGELSTRAAAAAAGFSGPQAVARILAKP